MSWVKYFEDLCRGGPEWMDYSNERVHLQTLGTALEASSVITGRRCLDVGCGRGQLVRLLSLLGASEAIGVDQTPEHVARLKAQHPDLTWSDGDIRDAAFRSTLGKFGLIYLLEVLQYLPVPEIFDHLWSLLEPGGRIIATFPNEECPIVQRTIARFEGRYTPPPVQKLLSWTRAVPGMETYALRGLAFQADQRLTPYQILPWTQEVRWEGDPPNRLQYVVQKQTADAG